MSDRSNAYRMLRIAAQHVLSGSKPLSNGGFKVKTSALRALSRSLDRSDELENVASGQIARSEEVSDGSDSL